MKNRVTRDILFFILGIIITASITIGATLLYKAQDIEFKPINNDWNVDNVDDALNELYKDSMSNLDMSGTPWEFRYNGTTGADGSTQEFKVPITGIYKLEAWGAQGGGAGIDSNYPGGYGAYASGFIKLEKDDILYVYIGGNGLTSTDKAANNSGGYNGGGYSYHWRSGEVYQGSGGGATHIATVSGELSTLESYKGIYNSVKKVYESNEILIVAGGGGGTARDYRSGGGDSLGGNAGGIVGNDSYYGLVNDNSSYGKGGTQELGGTVVLGSQNWTAQSGTFGHGGDSISAYGGAAGGAGWYGGGGASGHDGAGGGSSYIANPKLTNKAMYCIDCTESTAEETNTISTTGNREEADKTNCPNGYSSNPISKCAKAGHGYAKITYIGRK